MTRKRVLLLLVLLAVTAAVPRAAGAVESLDATLRPYLAKYGLPALAAAVVRNGEVVASGAVGTRRVGADLPVSVEDRFHLGSDTKAMTALLAGMLVDEGKLRWDSTIGDVFPELAPKMDAGLGAVTLDQLLSHTSGIPGDNAKFGELLEKSMTQDGNLDEMRLWLVGQWSDQPLVAKPGTTFAYSNMGYTIVGAMIERKAGKTWEELVTERVFVPLGLESAGLGPQSSLGKVDAPLGHLVVDGKTKAYLAGPNGDNPLIVGPAGTAHMSLLDFARWAGWNAGEGKREPRLVSPGTQRKLHTTVIGMPENPQAAPGTPARGKYGLGWGEVSFTWSAEPFLFHGGSNQKNLAHVLVQPKQDFAMVVMANIANPETDKAFWALEEELYRKYGPAAAPSPG